MDKVKEMGEAPLGPLLFKFSLPAIAVMVVNGLYNFIDRIFIGQGMGTDALAAVTAGFPMMIIAMGADKREQAASVLGQGFAASLVAGLAVTCLGWAIMISTVSGTALNALLAPLFIFAFHWGVAGAAWATVIAQALAAALTLGFIQDRKSALRIEAKRLAPQAKTMIGMLKLGAPIALVQGLSLVMLIVGIAQGAQALWGFNYGAGKFDRVASLTRLTLIWTSLLALLFTLVLELFTRRFVAVFNPGDEALIALGTRGIAIFMLTFSPRESNTRPRCSSCPSARRPRAEACISRGPSSQSPAWPSSPSP